MTAAGKKETVNLSPRKILSGDLQRAEFCRAHFRVIVIDLETTLDDILKPEYWVNCGATLKGAGQHPFPIVEVIWQDGSRYIELMVIDANNLWAKVRVLRDIDLTKQEERPALEKARKSLKKKSEASPDPDSDNPFEIKWVSPSSKYGVIRKSDGERLTEGCESKEAAEQWIEDYNKSMAE